ncbi:FAD-dependent oxidoreductase [Mycobacterium simiae]|uniref:FAD-dependent oxidoreductase n=1 Tax=Mycobacterium simiae TaxID=1784 RepID=A0A5B1BRI3_MYCSI|nr:FAD-dependent monooxygenase [Mycobacterium simiae]KAA1250641.1 FAD-dependent oxidoreductase [Mycobacterium simiae]
MADEHVDIVISGAGPNGLMLAYELALAGIRPIVLDKLPGPSPEPKANGLVGQIVRMLNMRGLYQELSGDAGRPQPSTGWMFAAMPLNLNGLRDNSLYTMLIPQPRLVELLQRRARGLGVDVRWGHTLTDLQSRSESVAVEVSAPKHDYDIAASYLVGADGGRSLVRKTLGIAFPGSTSPTIGRLAHVHIPDELRSAEGDVVIPGLGRLPHGHSRFDRGGLLFADFEPGRSLLGTIEFGPPVGDEPMTLAELRHSVRRVIGVDIPLTAPKGAGPHALRRVNGQHTRHAEHYRRGPVLLLGDAAHVHSPMGGPGLNLGLQDAMNLGWKLAAQINGWAPEGLLDTYESERHPVGQRVMMHTLAQTALMAPGPEVAALRTVLGELFTIPEVTKQLAALLAGSDVSYDVGDDHPLSGRVVPDLMTAAGQRVDELLHDARPVLLDLTGGLAAAVPGWADRVTVIPASIPDPPAAAMLIRPDGYVVWATDTSGPTAEDGLRAALGRWFGCQGRSSSGSAAV